MPPENELIRATFRRKVLRVLNDGGFRDPHRWPNVVVILRENEQRATSRADFAGWLRANDIGKAALECTRRRVRPGSVLVWLEAIVGSVEHVGFVLVNLSGRQTDAPDAFRTIR